MARCRVHDVEIPDQLIWLHVLEHIFALEAQMSEFANDQAHLDADVQAMTTAFADVVAELKGQAAAGQPLDFANADSKLPADDGSAPSA